MVVRLGASKVVVGLPLSLNWKEGQAALDATCEAKSLSEALTVPVVLHDERFSTAVAHNYFKETGTSHKKRRDKIDAAAATVILQSWLDCYGDSTSANSGGGFAPSKRF
jgi:putative Holliday junction resolvase